MFAVVTIAVPLGFICIPLVRNLGDAWSIGIPKGDTPARPTAAFAGGDAMAGSPRDAASALAKGEALLNRWHEREAWEEATLAGKMLPLPPGAIVAKVDWSEAMNHLASIAKDDVAYPKAQRLLQSMAAADKKAAEHAAAMEEGLRAQGREQFAAELDRVFFEKRMNADVSADGPQNTTLRIDNVLTSNVLAHDLQKSGIIEKARSAGFKLILFADGHDASWTWELTP
jgi:hypothetical protein